MLNERAAALQSPSTSPSPSPRPFLLDGSGGPLLATYFPPSPEVAPAGDMLFVPPFAEEMNRCRAMVALQARALARVGVGTLVVDLYGTGDSSGEFVDASWDIWRDDLTRALAWLRTHGHGCNRLWGVRLGAILAAELAQQDGAIDHLLLWQPVLNGKTFHTQFLRIRIAAEMELPNRIKSTTELRDASARGEPIEVSGYHIGPELARALDSAELSQTVGLKHVESDWFEVLAAADTPIGRANAKAAEEFNAAGVSVRLDSVVGPPFWHVHERELALALIDATTERVRGWRPTRGLARNDASFERRDATATALLPLSFACGDEQLSGMLHRAATPGTRGVVIVVAGGPQYRAGAHRQFVSLARKLAAQGLPVLRFDLRGMGDSSGSYLGFEQSEPDIRAAIDTLMAHEPQLRDVVLLGECESASGILFYAWRDARVKGAVLINPWVRTVEGQAQVIIKHYYLDRVRSKEFWQNVRSGQFDVRASLVSMAGVARAYVRGRKLMAQSSAESAQDDISGLPLPVRTAVGLSRFKGQSLLLMSGHDYIAREFDEVTAASKAWQGLLDDKRITRRDIEGADHTFSKAGWKAAAQDAVVQWLRQW